jgi:FAD/FMN-containing dehydrogenase
MDEAPAAPHRGRLGRFLNEMVVENGVGWLASEALHRYPPVRRLLEAIAPHIVATEDAYATPRLVKHHEVEYALPIERAEAVLRELEQMFAKHGSPTVFPVEVRFAPGEDVPLSPSYHRDTVWIAVHTWVKEDHQELFDRAEQIFLRHRGRPHWGKLHTRDRADLVPLYPEWQGWQAARDAFDPDRVFANPYVARLLGA